MIIFLKKIFIQHHKDGNAFNLAAKNLLNIRGIRIRNKINVIFNIIYIPFAFMHVDSQPTLAIGKDIEEANKGVTDAWIQYISAVIYFSAWGTYVDCAESARRIASQVSETKTKRDILKTASSRLGWAASTDIGKTLYLDQVIDSLANGEIPDEIMIDVMRSKGQDPVAFKAEW